MESVSYYDNAAASFLLGNLLNYPETIRSGKYPLDSEDFEPCLWHDCLFRIINTLALRGMEDINEIAVAEYCEEHPRSKEIMEDNKGIDFIRTVKAQNVSNTIEVHYPVVRKFTIIRRVQGKGKEDVIPYDMRKLCDEAWPLEKQLEALNLFSIQDLIDLFDNKVIQLKKDFAPNKIREEMWAGEGFDQVLEDFEESPVMGAGMNSPYETAIFRGFQKGHLLLRSAPSGKGKTTRAIADLCFVACKKLWDDKKKKFVDNPNYQGKGFYIHTEMDMEKELQPKFVAYIAGLPYHYIFDGKYSDENRERLREAGRILKDSGIKLINMPDFTIPLLRDTVRELSLTHECEYGVFDYVEDNGIVSSVYRQETGASTRPDIILAAIITAMKAIAEDSNVGLLTMSQLNGKESENEIIDERCLFGAKAMKNKTDGGMICLPPKALEMEKTQYLMEKRGFVDIKPNMVTHIFKARFSRYGDNLKIFQHFDFGTGRIQDCYVTNLANEPIHIDKIYINNNLKQ